MKMKNTVLFIFLVMVKLGFSQDYAELRHVQSSEYKYDFYVSTDHKKIRHKDTVVYTWYKSQKLMSTQGSSSGNILNGTFKKYYLTSQLAESGTYKMGLKVGKWQTWDEKGLLTSVSNYSKGQLKGKYYLYQNGKLVKTSTYKKGKELVEETSDDDENLSEGDEKESFFKKVFSKKESKEDGVEKEKKKWFSKKDKESSTDKKEKQKSSTKKDTKEKKTKE